MRLPIRSKKIFDVTLPLPAKTSRSIQGDRKFGKVEVNVWDKVQEKGWIYRVIQE